MTTSPDVASQRVAEIIAERIHSGQLGPGDRLKQGELALELGVSRIPVRDALRVLASRGMVELRDNAGARVVALSRREMEMSYRIREQLEPMLLADSIPHLAEADMQAIAECKARLDAVHEVEDYMPLSRAFHWAAFAGHRSPLLAQIVERLWDTTQGYRRAFAALALRDAERMAIMRSERDLLFGAIVRREVELAPMMLAQHIRRTQMALARFGLP